MKIVCLSAYTVKHGSSGVVLDFEEYSKFKYGFKPATIIFAKKLLNLFLEKYGIEYFLIKPENVIITTSPYWYTPPPAYSLTIKFHDLINELLLEKGCPPVRFMKIQRSSAPFCDFGKLNLAERKQNMKISSLSVDLEIFKGKKIILIEDARITGSHEKKVRELMKKAGVTELVFIYIVNVGKEIKNPKVENQMNHSWINNLKALSVLMKNPQDYILNARACRFILSYENKKELKKFSKKLSHELLFEIHRLSVNDGYGTLEKYKDGFQIINNEIVARVTLHKKQNTNTNRPTKKIRADHNKHKKVAIKLISFDIWGTLIKSNPAFKRIRSSIIAKEMKIAKDAHRVQIVAREVDDMLDKNTEITGNEYDCKSRIKLIAQKLNLNTNSFNHAFYNTLEEKISTAFLKMPPSLIETSIIDTLSSLKTMGISIALLSNTGFIKGKTMRIALKQLEILSYVDVALFSDEIGLAKPHPKIFEKLTKIFKLHPHQILHIGDNTYTDYDGAWQTGILSLLYDPDNKYADTSASIHNTKELLNIVKTGVPLHYSNLSLHTLAIIENKIFTESGEKFNCLDYSKFKYGDGSIARTYGYQLAERFIATNYRLLETTKTKNEFVITTSPFKSTPKGSGAIVTNFKNALNSHLLRLGENPITEISIFKDNIFEGDYSDFSEKHRKKVLASNKLFVPEKYIQGKKLIIIDDVRITGTHENNLITFFENKGVHEIYFLYVALVNPAQAKVHPEIETTLNHGWMTDLNKLQKIMNSEEFILNVRVCKYILAHKDTKARTMLLKQLNTKTLCDLYHGIIADGYASMKLYRNAFRQINAELKRREYQTSNKPIYSFKK